MTDRYKQFSANTFVQIGSNERPGSAAITGTFVQDHSLRCGMHCHTDAHCSFFSFKKETQQCLLHTNIDAPESVDGFKIFARLYCIDP